MKLTADDYANAVAYAATWTKREPSEREKRIYQKFKEIDLREGTPVTNKKDPARGKYLLLNFLIPTEENLTFYPEAFPEIAEEP